MTADLTTRACEATSPQEPGNVRRSSPAPVPTALDRSAAITPAPRPRRGRDGEPRRRRSSSNLWRLRYYLLPFRARFLATAVCALVGTGATIVVPLITKAVIDGPIAHSDQVGLYALGLLAITFGVIEAALTFLRRWVVARATNGVALAIRTDLYAKLQTLSMSFHDRWQSGQLLSRIMSDLATIRRFLGFGLLFILTNIAQILVTTAILLHMYAPLGLVVLASTVPI